MTSDRPDVPIESGLTYAVTAIGHWSEEKLDCEFMTPLKDEILFKPDAALFVSKMTVGFFKDYGYNVAMCAGRKMNLATDISCAKDYFA